MINYFLKRLLLLPITIFVIMIINFIIINLAPGDVSEAELDSSGEIGRSTKNKYIEVKNHKLSFREHYGLTLPIVFNHRVFLSQQTVNKGLKNLLVSRECFHKKNKVASYNKNLIKWGDRAPFIMPALLFEAYNSLETLSYRRLAIDLFIRGGLKQGETGFKLTEEQKQNNKKIAQSNAFLLSLSTSGNETIDELDYKVSVLTNWFKEQGGVDEFSFKGFKALKVFFFKTRLFRFFSRIIKLDFGFVRYDPNLKVITEVVTRLKASLILSVIPMIVVFIVCQLFAMIMAVKRNTWVDHLLNFIFLCLFSIPVFVFVPLLIEKVVLNRHIPFTNTPIPYSGLVSLKSSFDNFTSFEKILDVISHAILPLVAVSYGSLASQTRLARSAFLNVLKEDYIRTAWAKGLSTRTVLFKHVGRNASLIIITSLTSSLELILGGSLVVETLFEINGFGKFFYEAILNRDQNIILFSVFASSFLSLIGYFLGDILYMLLDPRVQLDRRTS